jgi:hypothetical protein
MVKRNDTTNLTINPIASRVTPRRGVRTRLRRDEITKELTENEHPPVDLEPDGFCSRDSTRYILGTHYDDTLVADRPDDRDDGNMETDELPSTTEDQRIFPLAFRDAKQQAAALIRCSEQQAQEIEAQALESAREIAEKERGNSTQVSDLQAEFEAMMRRKLIAFSSTAQTKKRVTVRNPPPHPSAATGGRTADTDAAGIGEPP